MGDKGKVQDDEQDGEYPEYIPGLGEEFIFQEPPYGMGGRIPDGEDGQAAHPEPEQCTSQGKGRSPVYGDGGVAEAGEDAAYGKEDADRFPPDDLKCMHIEKAHDGGREKQAESPCMEKIAYSAASRTKEEGKEDSRRSKFYRRQPQVSFHGQVGQQHPWQDYHKFQSRK